MGVVLAVAYLTVNFLLDVRIKDEEDLNMLFDVPVLAQIPAFLGDRNKQHKGYDQHPYESDQVKKGGHER